MQGLQRQSAVLKQMQGLQRLMFMILVGTSIITAYTLPGAVVIWDLSVDTCMLYQLIKMKKGK